MPTRVQLRRDTSANWELVNPTLASGEWGYDTTSGNFKIGDGVTAWNDLDEFLPSTVALAQEAVKLQTARNINGVAFDGTANITVTAAAGTLSGTTLAANVVSSSLTAVGTIATGVWQGTQIADTYLATIATVGKVQNSATSATAANTASAIVARDSNGDFTARNITATLFNGPATSAQSVAVADVTGLLSGGKILSSLLPGIALVSTSVVASEVAMLALTAETGDVAVRSDLNKTFILAGTDPTNLAHWQELLTPTDSVTSVAGRTGVVTLVSADITDATSAATASRIVIRDGSGGFAAVAISMSGTLTMTATASKIVPGATSFSIRNNADSADNLLISNAGVVTARAGLTVSAGNVTLTGTTIVGAPTWSNTQSLSTTGSAATLATVRTLWGQNFDGSGNVSGSLTSVSTIDMSGDLNLAGSGNIVNAAAIGSIGTITSTATGTSFAASGDVTIAAAKKLSLNAGKTTYFENNSDTVTLYASSQAAMIFHPASGGSADDMNISLWDTSVAALRRVSRGAADSGGTGFRLLRIANS